MKQQPPYMGKSYVYYVIKHIQVNCNVVDGVQALIVQFHHLIGCKKPGKTGVHRIAVVCHIIAQYDIWLHCNAIYKNKRMSGRHRLSNRQNLPQCLWE